MLFTEADPPPYESLWRKTTAQQSWLYSSPVEELEESQASHAGLAPLSPLQETETRGGREPNTETEFIHYVLTSHPESSSTG